ncbi:MAG: hypothetical protein IIA23_08650 [Chloroflexi bacterium]|nr:hypothetical protein [Chloroflexota bacterium]
MIRSDGRNPEELRPVTIEPGYLLYAEGSALIKTGNTTVLCAVTVEDGVPQFARGTGSGWITAEYSMLPRSTQTRTRRERTRTGGRTSEIQRLHGPRQRCVEDVRPLDLDRGQRRFDRQSRQARQHQQHRHNQVGKPRQEEGHVPFRVRVAHGYVVRIARLDGAHPVLVPLAAGGEGLIEPLISQPRDLLGVEPLEIRLRRMWCPDGLLSSRRRAEPHAEPAGVVDQHPLAISAVIACHPGQQGNHKRRCEDHGRRGHHAPSLRPASGGRYDQRSGKHEQTHGPE